MVQTRSLLDENTTPHPGRFLFGCHIVSGLPPRANDDDSSGVVMISVGNRIYMVSSSARFGAISSSCRAMYFLTWAVVFSVSSPDAKICSASWIVIWLASCLIDGTNAGLMLNRRRPMPSRSTMGAEKGTQLIFTAPARQAVSEPLVCTELRINMKIATVK